MRLGAGVALALGLLAGGCGSTSKCPKPIAYDEATTLGRGQHEMRGLMQDHVGLGGAVERGAVPIEGGTHAGGMYRHAAMSRQRQRLLPVGLGRGAIGAVGQGRADAGKGGARGGVVELSRKTVEGGVELLARDRGQDHRPQS